jgi:hypothetical protein
MIHRPLLLPGNSRAEIGCSCGDPAATGDDEFVAHIRATPADSLDAAGLRSAITEAIRFLSVVCDPIAAYRTLVAALDGEYPKPKPEPPAPPDPATPCTCGHRRAAHTSRDVSDVVGWPCRECRSERCHGFTAEGDPDDHRLR